MKKAQSISINTIIVAAIALIVMVVLIFIFYKGSKDIVTTTNSCISLGGECKSGKNCPMEYVFFEKGKCDSSQICCIKVLPSEG